VKNRIFQHKELQTICGTRLGESRVALGVRNLDGGMKVFRVKLESKGIVGNDSLYSKLSDTVDYIALFTHIVLTIIFY
jgi:hypothetical protein